MIAAAIFFIFILIFLALLALGFYPKAEQDEKVQKCGDAPLLEQQKAFKVLSYKEDWIFGIWDQMKNLNH